MEVLAKIKRCAIRGDLQFTLKARNELLCDELTPLDIRESLINARSIRKTLRSNAPSRSAKREYLYVIISPNLTGLLIYTKGKFIVESGVEVYYLLVSSKQST
ncbi:MAG: hypothetical protein ABSF29_06700 [Tepidisphaeraceae bacterium]|jgi:hypothetical protein